MTTTTMMSMILMMINWWRWLMVMVNRYAWHVSSTLHFYNGQLTVFSTTTTHLRLETAHHNHHRHHHHHRHQGSVWSQVSFQNSPRFQMFAIWQKIMMIMTKETDDGGSRRREAVTQREDEMELIRLRLNRGGTDGKYSLTLQQGILISFYWVHSWNKLTDKITH